MINIIDGIGRINFINISNSLLCMAKQNKFSMPSGTGGLVRYFDEYSSKITFKPGVVIIIVCIIILIEIILHLQGYGLLGF